MGVQPMYQGRLYWWQEKALIRQYHKEQEFMAKIGGNKIG